MLRNGHIIELNLDDRQEGRLESIESLDLLCLISNSWPEATIDWLHKRPSQQAQSASMETSPDDRNNINNSPKNRMDKKRLLNLLNGLLLKQDDNRNDLATSSRPVKLLTESDLDGKQWSSFTLSNVTFQDHRSVISCQAHNYVTTGTSSINGNGGGNGNKLRAIQTTKSFFVTVDIIRAPIIKLELESSSISKAKLDRSPNMIGDQLAQTTREPDPELKRDLDRELEPRLAYIPIGARVNFVCKVEFSNPPIDEPIGWFVNETYLLDDSFGHLNIVSREPVLQADDSSAELDDRPNRRALSNPISGERLAVEFKTIGPIRLHCEARNRLGSSSSNRVPLIAGPRPKCNQSSESLANSTPIAISTIDLQTGLFVKCPVLSSDKNSARFHWISRSKSTQTGSADTDTSGNRSRNGYGNQTDDKFKLTSSLTDTIEWFKLADHRSSAQQLQQTDNLTCFASDSFGSNQDSPCKTIFVSQSSARADLDPGKYCEHRYSRIVLLLAIALLLLLLLYGYHNLVRQALI